MPKKVDYRSELKTLKDVPDSELRPVTSRVPVKSLKKLYQICCRENRDLGGLCRQILEEQAEKYLATSIARSREATPKNEAPTQAAWVAALCELPEPTRLLVEQVCGGLATDFRGLVERILEDALPAWAEKAEKVAREREAALARLQGRPSPEAVALESYLRAAAAPVASLLDQMRQMAAEGAVKLELEGFSSLCLIAPRAADPGEEVDHRREDTLQALVEVGILVADEPTAGGQRKWRLDPQALQGGAAQNIDTTPQTGDPHRKIWRDVGPSD